MTRETVWIEDYNSKLRTISDLKTERARLQRRIQTLEELDAAHEQARSAWADLRAEMCAGNLHACNEAEVALEAAKRRADAAKAAMEKNA